MFSNNGARAYHQGVTTLWTRTEYLHLPLFPARPTEAFSDTASEIVELSLEGGTATLEVNDGHSV